MKFCSLFDLKMARELHFYSGTERTLVTLGTFLIFDMDPPDTPGGYYMPSPASVGYSPPTLTVSLARIEFSF